MDEFSKRLRQLRGEKELLQAELATKLHCSQAMMSAYENGREPPYDMLLSISRFFGVSTDFLLGLSQDRTPAGDDLSTAVELAASRAAEAGAPPVAASDLARVARRMAEYLARDPAAGAEPARLAAVLLTAMDGLLAALGTDSTAQVLDASDAMLAAVLDVNGVMGAFLQRKTGDKV